MHLLRSEYKIENGKPVVYFFTREDGERKIITSTASIPYFYIPANEIGVLQGIRADPTPYEAVDGTAVRKVYVTLPGDVPELRDKYSRTYEADILYGTRCAIDEVDSIEPTNPLVMFLDIEVDGNSGRVPDAGLAQEKIVSISVHNSLNNAYSTFTFRPDLSPGQHHEFYDETLLEVNYFKTEEEMLNEFTKFIQVTGPDIISGWNVIRFDLIYLLNRMKNLRLDINKLSPMDTAYPRDDDVVIKGVSVIDLYDAYRKVTYNTEESYTLDFIAKKITGEGKIEGGESIRWSWQHELEKLIKYNANDVRITRNINKKMKLIDFLDELRRLTFCQLEDTLSASRTCDSYILKLFHGSKIFPTKQHHKRVAYEGAFVGSWGEGIYENVVSFDLKSLYPSILCTFNLSPETILSEEESLFGDNISVNNIHVKKEPKGFLPQVIENLFIERAKYKTLMKQEKIESPNWDIYNARQMALKVLLNSLYGQTAYVGSRIYDPRIADTITFVGRKVINWSKDFLENIGYEVIYADTDSLSWSVGKEVDIDHINYILNLINDSYQDFIKQYGLSSHILEMEFEKIYKKAFFGKTKKRYCGSVCYKDGQEVDMLEVVGFEVRRSDSSQFSRKLQHKVFDMLLREDKPKDEVLRYIGDEIDRVRKGDFAFTEVGIPKGINKDLSQYGKTVIVEGKAQKKGIPANIRGVYNAITLGHDLSNKPKMVYVSKVPNHPGWDVLCFDEDKQVPPGTEIDIEKMLTKLVKDKVESIFEALGWKLSELQYHWKGKVKKGGEQLSLFS